MAARANDDVDIVQGYKISRADNLTRRVMGRVYHRFVALMFRLEIRDTDCDFRLMRRSALDPLQLRTTSGAICVELVYKLQAEGARFVEVGVDHYPGVDPYALLPGLGVLRTRSLWDLAKLWVELVVTPRLAASSRRWSGR